MQGWVWGYFNYDDVRTHGEDFSESGGHLGEELPGLPEFISGVHP